MTRVILFGFFPYSFSKTKDFLPAFINVQAFYVHLPILDLNKKKYVNEAVSFKLLHNEINKHIHQITLGMLENKNNYGFFIEILTHNLKIKTSVYVPIALPLMYLVVLTT